MTISDAELESLIDRAVSNAAASSSFAETTDTFDEDVLAALRELQQWRKAVSEHNSSSKVCQGWIECPAASLSNG